MCETFLLRVYYLNNLDDVDYKIYLFIYRCNQGIMTKCSNHERDALLRCMIAMMVQHEDDEFYARSKWCIRHNAITMMQCLHHDARLVPD
jgi:hypothetical protein